MEIRGWAFLIGCGLFIFIIMGEVYELDRVNNQLGNLTCNNFEEYYHNCIKLVNNSNRISVNNINCKMKIQLKNEECIKDLEFEEILKRSEK